MNSHGQPYSQLQACTILPFRRHRGIVVVSIVASLAYPASGKEGGAVDDSVVRDPGPLDDP